MSGPVLLPFGEMPTPAVVQRFFVALGQEDSGEALQSIGGRVHDLFARSMRLGPLVVPPGLVDGVCEEALLAMAAGYEMRVVQERLTTEALAVERAEFQTRAKRLLEAQAEITESMAALRAEIAALRAGRVP